MKKKNKIELLAPAGGREAFIAAVENGADAVYVGGRLFNARMNAGNFDDKTMALAVDYAHKRGVKVFVTMNTLLCDEELGEALNYARFLYETGADALIVQDLGLGRLIGERLPGLPRHLSTQATVCDEHSVRAAAALGYERVVLARELSLEEIRKACACGAAEIEVFVHGALCICYSGQCQMSRFYGGRSGNRGECAQPCRLPYEAVTADGQTVSGHLLSPRDLCLIDSLGELIEAGVRSFKIEGRMKQPEYVAVVTSIYRKYIDEYLAKGRYKVDPADSRALEQIFNRGGFTEAYLYGDPGEELMSPAVPKNRGIELGTVSRAVKGSELIDIRAERTPAVGDGIEIRRGNEAVSSRVMTFLRELGGNGYRIGDFRGDIRPGDTVYRTSSIEQHRLARESYRHVDLESDRPGESRRIGRRRPVDLTLKSRDGFLELTAATVAEREWESQRRVSATRRAGPFEADAEAPAPKSRFEQALRKTGNTPFEVSRLRYIGEFDLRVRMSELNALRRECLEALEEEIVFRRSPVSPSPEGDACRASDGADSRFAIEPYDCAEAYPLLAALCREAAEKNVSLAGLAAERKIGAARISCVSRGREDALLEGALDEIKALGRDFTIYVGNPGWLYRLSAAGLDLRADSGLNICNSECMRALLQLGAEGGAGSPETSVKLQEAGFTLMTTQHDFPYAELRNESRGIYVAVKKEADSSVCKLIAVESKMGNAPRL